MEGARPEQQGPRLTTPDRQASAKATVIDKELATSADQSLRGVFQNVVGGAAGLLERVSEHCQAGGVERALGSCRYSVVAAANDSTVAVRQEGSTETGRKGFLKTLRTPGHSRPATAPPCRTTWSAPRREGGPDPPSGPAPRRPARCGRRPRRLPPAAIRSITTRRRDGAPGDARVLRRCQLPLRAAARRESVPQHGVRDRRRWGS